MERGGGGRGEGERERFGTGHMDMSIYSFSAIAPDEAREREQKIYFNTFASMIC